MRKTMIAMAFGLILQCAAALGCNVPVFEYALEFWQPEAYELLVLHRGELSDADKAILKRLEAKISSDDFFVNLSLSEADLSKQQPDWVTRVYEELPAEQLPAIVLMYPRGPIIWSGKLEWENIRAILDSPARREIARLILDGEAAVWVLVRSGNEEADKAALDLLTAQLDKMEKELKFPQWMGDIYSPEEEPESEGFGPTFSLVSISRNDTRERVLLNMLLRSEPDLDEYADKPMVFPVFGRGRVLCAIVGDGINEQNIQEACEFVIGPCSCQVKAFAPGIDLLMAVNWDAALEGEIDWEKLPTPAPAAATNTIEAEKGGSSKRLFRAVVLVVLLILATDAILLFCLRKRLFGGTPG